MNGGLTEAEVTQMIVIDICSYRMRASSLKSKSSANHNWSAGLLDLH